MSGMEILEIIIITIGAVCLAAFVYALHLLGKITPIYWGKPGGDTHDKVEPKESAQDELRTQENHHDHPDHN